MKLRFVTGNDWISRLIRLGERDGWCTHVEAVLPDGEGYLGAYYNGGVQIRPVGYDRDSTTRELIVDLLCSPSFDGAFYSWLRRQLGKPYDWRGVIGLGLGRDWRDEGSWFCSELQARALEAARWAPPLAAMNNHISPRDLLLILSGRVKIDQE